MAEARPTEYAAKRYSAAFECSTCHRAYREPEPRLFSFNNPYGACPRCQGFGNTIDFDPNLILPDRSRTLAQGAIAPWTTPKYRPFHGEMIRFAKSASIPTDVPYYDLDPPQQELLWNGPGSGPYPGIRGFFAALERKKYKLHVRVFLSKYRGYALCPDCHGQRLRAEARAVLITPQNGPAKNICEVSALTITAAQSFFDNLELTPAQFEIAGKILEEVRQRIHFLIEVGLEYLTLDRLSSTLSGGESQRIQLATSLGSRLVGALYVLDEPSIGLHPRDTAKLIRILHSLRDLGNTILVVEHDPAVIRSADHLLDLGPGAGELGGHVLAAGTVAEVTANPNSITGKYLSSRLTIPIPRHRREPGSRTPPAHRRPPAQPARHRCRNSPQPPLLRHRRQRQRQVHAHPPGPLRRAQQAAPPRTRKPPRPSQPSSSARSPARNTSTTSSSSTSRPSAAPRAPIRLHI